MTLDLLIFNVLRGRGYCVKRKRRLQELRMLMLQCKTVVLFESFTAGGHDAWNARVLAHMITGFWYGGLVYPVL